MSSKESVRLLGQESGQGNSEISPVRSLRAWLAESRTRSTLFRWAGVFLAPVVLTATAGHELSYNSSPVGIWFLSIALIWVLVSRRRKPIVVFGVTLALVLVLCVLGVGTTAFAAVLVALYSVAAHRPFRYALACAVILEGAVVLVSQLFAPRGSIDDSVLLLTGIAAASLFLGTTLKGNRSHLSSVEERAARLELEKAQQAELAALAERARIAREMHDIVAHGLSVVITLAEGAAATAETDAAKSKEVMKQVAAGGRQSLAEMRKLLEVLRADDGGERAPQPDLVSLGVLMDDVRRTGLRVDSTITGDTAFASDAVQATVYRIVQEALTNVIKHSPSASVATVSVDFAETAHFEIRDDGGADLPPITKPPEGNGLLGMRERVAIFNGSLEAGPTDFGWRVRGSLRLS